MIKAPKVQSGVYPVILDPLLAGVFTHEAFGHLSEADFVYENPKAKALYEKAAKIEGLSDEEQQRLQQKLQSLQ